MAGWVVAWTRDGSEIDPQRWASTLSACTRLGGEAEQSTRAGAGLAAWRRTSGEFPCSGRLTHARLGTHTAFVGQVLSDAGADDSLAAIGQFETGGADDAAMARLNGPFAMCTIGPGPRDVRIASDRHRHYGVFVHRGARWTVASTDLGCVLPWLDRVEIDRDSLDLLVRTGELIDRMTLVKGVEVLPPACVLSDDGSGPRERTYWEMRHREDWRDDPETIARRLGELLAQSVRRIERANPRLGVTLSGGLDSRFILGLCERRREIPSFTWGLPGCRDIACAAAFARRIGSPHTIRHWNPPEFPPLWPAGADLTAGSFGIESMHMLPYVGLLARHADVILNGLAGDVMYGGNFLKASWLRETSVEALAATSWRWRVGEGIDAWGDRLLGASARSRGRWVHSISSGAESGVRPVLRLNDWLYPNRVFRYTNSGTALLRWGVESHAPFFDRDVVDAALRVPQEMKLKHRLYLRALAHACPDAAATPWQRTMVPPAWGFWANTGSMAMQRIVRVGLKKVGVEAWKSNSVADLPGWLRGLWAGDVERLLFDGRLAGRGLVDDASLRSAWESHKAGENLTRPLAALIAVECFARRWMDGDVPSRLVPTQDSSA